MTFYPFLKSFSIKTYFLSFFFFCIQIMQAHFRSMHGLAFSIFFFCLFFSSPTALFSLLWLFRRFIIHFGLPLFDSPLHFSALFLLFLFRTPEFTFYECSNKKKEKRKRTIKSTHGRKHRKEQRRKLSSRNTPAWSFCCLSSTAFSQIKQVWKPLEVREANPSCWRFLRFRTSVFHQTSSRTRVSLLFLLFFSLLFVPTQLAVFSFFFTFVL